MHEMMEVRRRLEKENATFRRLSRKHQEFEARLETLNSYKFLSEDEQLETARIKKMKLALKDQMEVLIRGSVRDHDSH